MKRLYCRRVKNVVAVSVDVHKYIFRTENPSFQHHKEQAPPRADTRAMKLSDEESASGDM